MDLVWDLLGAAGVAAAIGMRPFLPVLLVGALANAHAGINFSHSDFAFLQAWPFLLAVVLLVVGLDFVARRAGSALPERGAALIGFVLIAIVLGALEGGGFVAHHKGMALVGCALGAGCSTLGFLAMRSLLMRTSRRLDTQAADALPIYAEGMGLLVAALAVFVAPLSLVVIAALIWLMVRARRRDDKKYAGLRVLR